MYSLLVGLLLWNYYAVVNTDPGSVPPGYVSGILRKLPTE